MAEPAFPNVETPIGGVMSEQLLDVLPHVMPLLQSVVTPESGETVETVIAALLMKETQLWVIGNFQAITITRIQDRPTGRVLWNEWTAGSDMQSWVQDWLKVQEAFAREHGCVAIECHGRRGYFRRYMPESNFKAIRTLYRCEL